MGAFAVPAIGTASRKLAQSLTKGRAKFLESIVMWIDINAPRYWWSEFDTYRVGTSKQSESTMHTLKKELLTHDNFEEPIDESYLTHLNELIAFGADIGKLKNALPEGFLQRRIVCTNYKVLRNMIKQREQHRLKQWRYFCNIILETCHHKEFLV